MGNNHILRVAIQSCNFCHTVRYEKTIADRLIRTLPENEVFIGKLKIVECRTCGLRYLNPMPHPEDLSLIYNYHIYRDSTNNNPILQEQFYNLMSEYALETKCVLEVGCGTGEFLAYLEKHGIQVSGVEFADSSQVVKFKGMLYAGRIEEVSLPENEFDAIFLLNVLEHLIDPQEVLKKIRTTLKERGILILRHPNSDLFFCTVYKYLLEMPKYLIHRGLRILKKKTRFTILGFQNQHLFYFNYKTMNKMLNDCGYTLEFFTTKDAYNLQRLREAFQDKQYIEGTAPLVRHLLSHIGLGPECVFVARRTTE